MINETQKIPAAACQKCGGWTSFGGMSQHSKSTVPVMGRTGCTCSQKKEDTTVVSKEIEVQKALETGYVRLIASHDGQIKNIVEYNKEHVSFDEALEWLFDWIFSLEEIQDSKLYNAKLSEYKVTLNGVEFSSDTLSKAELVELAFNRA